VSIDPEQKAQWLYELRLNGFILFRNFLPLALIESMREQFNPLLEGELIRIRSGDGSALRGDNRLSFDIAAYVQHLKGPLDDDRFRRNPLIEELVTAVLGRWRYGVTKAECPLRDSNVMTWHPDVPNDTPCDPSGAVRPVRLTFNLPLVDIDETKGPMQILPGSHRLHHGDAPLHIDRVPLLYPATITMRRGDAMLRDGNALHRGTTNRTEEPRILLDQTYRSAEAGPVPLS